MNEEQPEQTEQAEPAIEPEYSPAEARLRLACQAAFEGSLDTVVSSVTSEAYVDILRISAAITDISMPEGYEIEETDAFEDEFRYQVTVKAPERDIVAYATVKKVKNNWLIAAIKIPGIRD